jgi:hypothetical protein
LTTRADGHKTLDVRSPFAAAAAALCGSLLLVGATGCPKPTEPRPYPDPTADEILAHLRTLPERVPNLRADSVSDVRIGKERAKLSVNIAAAWGGKLRFQAHAPNDATVADLAADGQTYCFIDSQHDCGGCGPATPENVGRLIRIEMPPDDVVAVLMGSTPVLDHATATVRWDTETAREILELKAGELTQRIELDGREHRWDVLDSVARGPGGKLLWRIQHKEFHAVGEAPSEGATAVRLPGKSLFEQVVGGRTDDALIDWRTQEIGVELHPSTFSLTVPDGLPACR